MPSYLYEILQAFPSIVLCQKVLLFQRCRGTKAELKARVGRPLTSRSPQVILLLAVLRRLFCFGSLVILDVVCRYLSLFFLFINIKIGKNRCELLD